MTSKSARRERCDDLGKSHAEMALHFAIDNIAMFSVRAHEAYYFVPKRFNKTFSRK